MISHSDVTTWGFFTPQKARASATPLNPDGYNSSYLKPQFTRHEILPVQGKPSAFKLAKAVIPHLHKYTNYNPGYLKAKPGTYKHDPKLTPWSQENALAQLRSSGVPEEKETKLEKTLEEKLIYLIEAEPMQAAKWTQYLGELQAINLYAEKHPLNEYMKSTFIKIQDAVRQRFDQAQSFDDDEYNDLGVVGIPRTATDISDPIIAALQALNNPTAAEIATAIQGAIGNNPTAADISGPIIAAVRALGRNPSADEIAAAVGSVLPATTQLAKTVDKSSEGKDESSPMIKIITQNDIRKIRAKNTRNNSSPKNIKQKVWRYVATKAGIPSTITNKDQIMDAVLNRSNDPSVNLLLNAIKIGSITRNSTANDFQQLLEMHGLED